MQHNGHYSVVQFLPDISRQEVVNIGVVLLEDTGKVRSKLLSTNARIKQFFGKQDWVHIDFLKTSLVSRLAREHFESIEDFSSFAARRANAIQMTPPRSIAIDDVNSAVDDLFSEMVASQPSHRRKRIDVRLGESLQAAGVRSLVRHSVRVNFPLFDEPFRAPYGYQNGRFNLITAVQFNLNLREFISKAAEKALEGRVLFENPDPQHGPLTLNVIGKFSEETNEKSRAFVEDLMRENNVKLYDFENLAPLLKDIKEAHFDHIND